VPSLRQRRKDLPELIDIFIDDIVTKNQLTKPDFSENAIDALTNYNWPGNVRQLQNVIQRLLILSGGSEITVEDVSSALEGDMGMHKRSKTLPDYFESDMRKAKEAFEKAYLSYHLSTVDGNVSALAKKVGLERTHLYRKLKSLDISARNAK